MFSNSVFTSHIAYKMYHCGLLITNCIHCVSAEEEKSTLSSIDKSSVQDACSGNLKTDFPVFMIYSNSE